MTRVLTFGTFDIVHKGHKYYLEEAKKLGDELFIIIARDKNVLQDRKKIALNNEKKRKKEVETLAIADKVILGFEENRLQVIKEYNPDIICLGYDQNSLKVEEYIKLHNLSIKIIRINSFQPEIYKSSKFKNVIK